MNEPFSMRILLLYSVLCILLFLTGCIQLPEGKEIYKQMEQEFNAGNLENTFRIIDSLKTVCPGKELLIHKAESLSQIAERIYLEFSISEEEIISRLRKSIGEYSQEEKEMWEKNNWLEWRMIDGEKRYFNRSASNLNLIKNFHLKRALRDSLEAEDPGIVFRKEHAQSIIGASDNQHLPIIQAEMVVKYTLTVVPNAVPEGETVKCWLPWPKEYNIRQQNIRFISASDNNYIMSPDSVIHRTIYMEAIAEKNKPVIFNASFSYQSSGQYFDPEGFNILPYNTNSTLFKKYTT